MYLHISISSLFPYTTLFRSIFPVLEGQMVPIEDIAKMVHEGKLESPVAEDIERKYEQFRQEFTDRKSTRLNSSHANISYAVFCLKKKKILNIRQYVTYMLSM